MSARLAGVQRRSVCGAAALGAAVGLATGLSVGRVHAQTADAQQALRDFVRTVQSGRASFTQTVTAADNSGRRKVSSGQFEFARPNRFRFSYAKPYEQLIVSDGQKVWIHDPDLNQASARKLAQVLGSTPAAILAGGSIEPDFELKALPSKDGMTQVQATPKDRGGPIQSLRVGLKGNVLAELEILDSFGQRSLIVFSGFEPNAPIAAERFRFVPPPGTDVIEQ